MVTVSGSTDYTVSAGAKVTGTTAYTVQSATVATVTGSTPFVVSAAAGYVFYRRVGTALLPVQLGKRRGGVIDWLTPDLSASAVARYDQARYDSTDVYAP